MTDTKYTVVYLDGTQQSFYIRGYAEMQVRLYGARIVCAPTLTLVKAA